MIIALSDNMYIRNNIHLNVKDRKNILFLTVIVHETKKEEDLDLLILPFLQLFQWYLKNCLLFVRKLYKNSRLCDLLWLTHKEQTRKWFQRNVGENDDIIGALQKWAWFYLTQQT